jgi:hypothetical protein
VRRRRQQGKAVLERGVNGEATDRRYDTLLQLAKASRTDSEAKVELLLKYKYGGRWIRSVL